MIPFNKPCAGDIEIQYATESIRSGHLRGDGPFTKRAVQLLSEKTGCQHVLLTHSCTAALEMAAILLDLKDGDEVIMPSFTFVSTANAFVLRGCVPVFVDVRPDTLNIDEQRIVGAITSRTRAIVVVHYAGVSCDMAAIMKIAEEFGLPVVEDAAQALGSSYRGRPLGGIGHLGCLSFHDTKNIIAGEGGALLVNDERYLQRAEIIREKGTNRSQFFRGQVDKYTWCDIGSSYLPSDIIAAVLCAQLERLTEINAQRLRLWQLYHEGLDMIGGYADLPVVPEDCTHNAHMFYLMMKSLEEREGFMEQMRMRNVQTAFHYVALHSSPAGRRYGRANGSMKVTERASDCLVRLPMWAGLETRSDELIQAIRESLFHKASS